MPAGSGGHLQPCLKAKKPSEPAVSGGEGKNHVRVETEGPALTAASKVGWAVPSLFLGLGFSSVSSWEQEPFPSHPSSSSKRKSFSSELHRTWECRGWLGLLLPFYFDFLNFLFYIWGFPGDSDGKESTCNAVDLGSILGSGRFPWRREWLPTPVFLPGEFQGQRGLAGYSPWGRKESDTAERLTLSFILEYGRLTTL